MTDTIPKKIVSLYRPVVITLPSKRYLVITGSEQPAHNGWYEVDDKFNLSKVLKTWKQLNYQENTLKGAWTWKVQNSKKNGYYTVSFDKAGWTCDCTGFGYRRKCRHIDEAKTKMN